MLLFFLDMHDILHDMLSDDDGDGDGDGGGGCGCGCSVVSRA